ncbi:MAG TPA: MFS transporter [Anaerolineales bacterium]|nr:MFS transporter [Anaerolineales bacterium]
MKLPFHKNVAVLSFALIVVMLGFGMVIPIFPFYIERLGAGGSAFGLLVAIAALTELIFGPFWGSLSDRTGRKPILMIGMLGFGLSMVLFGISTQLWQLFLFRGLSGVLSSATLSPAMAYIGDSTPERDRGGSMGALGAAAGLGLILGPALGGLLAGSSLATPFFVGAGLAVVAAVLIGLFLPESLPRPARKADGRIGFLNVRELGEALRSPIGVLLLLAFLATVGTSNFEAIFSLYAVDALSYGPEQVGLILSVVGVVALVGRGVLTGVFTRRWGEPVVIQGALLAAAVTFVLLLLAQSFAAVLLTVALFVLIAAFLRPAIHSLTSQRATVGQGAAMGLSGAFVSLGRIVGPLWAGAVYDLRTWLPYASGAVILVCVFLLSRRWLGGKAAGLADSPADPVTS